MMMDSYDECNFHNNRLELICFDCNIALCSQCSPQHSQHSFEHIKNIKSNNSCHFSIDKLGESIEKLWSTVKTKISIYEQLEHTETDISNKFNELHEHLRVEEHRLKKPIVSHKDELEQLITNDINNMKSLNSIINSLVVSTKGKEELDKEVEEKLTDNIISEDIKESYTIRAIIESIKQSNNINEFIKNNIDTLFYSHDINTNKQSDINDDNIILHLIINHNSNFKYDYTNSNNNNDTDSNNNNNNNNILEKLQQQYLYNLHVNNKSIDSYKKDIRSSFKLVHQYLQKTKSTYIFTTDDNRKATLITLPINCDDDEYDDYKVENLDVELSACWSYNSTITVGEYIYSFGGGFLQSKIFQRFSMASRSIDIERDMDGVDPCRFVSVAHDGADLIYILDGDDREDTIVYRYNIVSQTFERYSIIKNYVVELSFFYDQHLYSVSSLKNRIIKFNPATKTTVELPVDLSKYNRYRCSMCTDGQESDIWESIFQEQSKRTGCASSIIMY
ncbi:hypothetical protein PPL_07389 [Heterostelium album PN500]|uniref:B box-type domain-containing protein n=1 Tax=Heterostelium pallidum (strain ATCC 26659 / Pp 5 / PN500) TaxID=670386 RepID=D3BFT8_HETP5|nr:hypothetical protein PPL_07389 [Heterostelium album PN500]EFA79698.1 hypothetical protein PPL_07389 [Heterostelium album PN500]|eukprot:XP_020431819.1 hypothetical protein PPL_07389 [Heterostelium album PN500]